MTKLTTPGEMKASYRDLKVWQNAMGLAEQIYAVTASFPASERYGITQQMRRAAVSVPSNIAEGYGRRTPRQRYRFLETALGSLFELETQTELSARLNFMTQPDTSAVTDAIRGLGRGLTALMRYVETETHPEELRGTPRNSEELQGTPRNPEELRGTPRNPEEPRGTPRNPEEPRGTPRNPEELQGTPRNSKELNHDQTHYPNR